MFVSPGPQIPMLKLSLLSDGIKNHSLWEETRLRQDPERGLMGTACCHSLSPCQDTARRQASTRQEEGHPQVPTMPAPRSGTSSCRRWEKRMSVAKLPSLWCDVTMPLHTTMRTLDDEALCF